MKAQEHTPSFLQSTLPVALHGEEGGVLSASAAFLMRPAYLPPSAWTEHLPFAFWIIEALRPRILVELGTHWGASYFGFCQAVRHFGVNTACYAVDTWQGDEQAGLYGEEVFKRVCDHNRKNYSGFSSVIRSTFDKAQPYFQDGSIDLLHIDGLHTYDAVRADFESWLPKLSDRAIVLMHDTNVREREFGVFRFFAELRERFPCFEFLHGHGLGVIGLGGNLPASLRALFEVDSHAEGTQDIRQLFAHLGEDCQDRLSLTTLETETVRLQEIIGTERKRIKVLEDRLTTQHESLSAKAKDLSRVVSKLQAELQVQRDMVATAERDNTRLSAEMNEVIRHLADTPVGQQKPRQLKTVTDVVVRLQELAAMHKNYAQEREQSARIERDNKRLHAEMGELTRRLVQTQQGDDKTRQSLKDARRLADDMTTRFRKLEVQVRAERLDTKKRIATILDNAQRLVRAFAPDQPSGVKVALFPSLKALVRRVRATGLVDDEWYLKTNPDVREAGLDPSQHYVLHGAAEARLPRDMTKSAE